MIMKDSKPALLYELLCRKSCVYVIKTFLMRIEFDCLVDRKGIGIEPVIVSNFNQSENTLYNLQYLCSRNRSVL